MDLHKIFTQNSRGGWADDLRFKILIFAPSEKKIWLRKNPKISTNFAEWLSIGNS